MVQCRNRRKRPGEYNRSCQQERIMPARQSAACESALRFAVAVTVNDPAAPTGSATQDFCAIDNPTVANLTATGSAIKWYNAASGGTALVTTTALATETYYASQTIGSCESALRFAVAVTVNNPAAPTEVQRRTSVPLITRLSLILPQPELPLNGTMPQPADQPWSQQRPLHQKPIMQARRSEAANPPFDLQWLSR